MNYLLPCRRSKSELIGSNVSTIVPFPYSKYHDLYLKRFAKTGKSFVVDRTRSLFGKTGSNVLIPLIMHFREVPPDQQQTVLGPRFSAVMHSPKTSENFLLFDNKENGFTVIHADSRTHAMFLGIDPSQLEHLEVSLSHYLPQLEDKSGTQCDRSDEPSQTGPSSFSGLPRNPSNASGQHDTQNSLRISAPASSFHKMPVESDEYWDEETQRSNWDEGNQKNANWDSFLRKLQRKGEEYEEVFTRNTADSRTAKILARVQAVDVPDYGFIYLLAWKPKGGKPSLEHQGFKKEFDISRTSSCPFSKEEVKVSQVGAHTSLTSCTANNHNYEMSDDSHKIPGIRYNRSNEASVLVSNKSTGSSTPFINNAVAGPHSPPFQEGTPKPIALDSKNGEDCQNELQDSQVIYSWGTAQSMSQKEEKHRRNSIGKSSTGTRKSVTGNLLRSVIRSGATELNNIAHLIKRLLLGLLIVYIVLAATSSIKLQGYFRNSFGQTVNVDQGGSEMNSYFSLQLSALKMFTTNSVYKNTVENQNKLWRRFSSQTNIFIEEALKSRSHSRTIRGAAHKWGLEAKFEIQDRFRNQGETLSFDELREFIVSHVRELRSFQNSSEFRPKTPPHSVSLLLDNSAVIKLALGSSAGERISQFMSFIDKSQSVLLVITFSLLTVLCISTLSVICYSLYNINVKKKNILKTFLLLASPVVKKLRDAAATSLREHVETVNKLELTIADGGSESSRSLDSDMEEEDEETFPLLKPRTGTETSEPGQKWEKSTNQQHSLSRGPKVPFEDTHSIAENKYALRNFRQHKDSSKATFSFLAQLTSPLIVLLVWGIITFTKSSSAINAARQEVKRMRVTQKMFSEVLEYEDQINLLALRVQFPQLIFGNASQEQLTQFRHRVTSLQRSIAESSTALVEGGHIELTEGATTLNTLSSTSKLFDVWQRDGCSVLSEKFQTVCQEVDLRNGLRSFLRAIFNRGNEIIAEFPPVSEDSESAMEKILNSRQLQEKLREFNSLFYPLPSEIMEWISDHLLENISTKLDNSLEAHRVATAVCVVLFAILAVIVSVPVMEKLTQTLVASISLLVLIPESAINCNRALRYQVKDVTQRLAVSNTNTEDAAIISMLSSE